MMRYRFSSLACAIIVASSCALLPGASFAADVPVPIATDSRIKTFVYNENDVFSLLTHFGYQCNIEFGRSEEVETISLGDKVGWQVVPAGRRLFIRAMEESARTNMTVVTNKRAYQFDLKSSSSTMVPNEELVYVVRFFYPDDKQNRLAPAPYSDDFAPVTYAPAPIAAPLQVAVPAAPPAYNYRYTLTGPNHIAPVKMFDDGRATYFKFKGAPPKIMIVLADGREIPATVRAQGEYIVVNHVAPRFSLRSGSDVVCIFNEAGSRM